jgi:hypothetical protein
MKAYQNCFSFELFRIINVIYMKFSLEHNRVKCIGDYSVSIVSSLCFIGPDVTHSACHVDMLYTTSIICISLHTNVIVII